MNFQTLIRVEEADFYLGVAFRKAKTDSALKRGLRYGSKIKKSRALEKAKLEAIKKTLNTFFNSIIKSYPSLRDLPPFYYELLKLSVDVDDLKKSLGAINWANKKVSDFYNIYNGKLQHATEITRMNDYRREFYGRISSLLKQIKKDFIFLEQARRLMKKFPTIKTSVKTIAIVGFPNVGKTTLLFKLTGSKPEIKNYAFTTKTVNVSYLKTGKNKIQLVDTPGSLARFEKMNDVERVSVLVVKYVAEKLIYVFDLTESAYPLKDQITLYNELKKYKKPMIVYLSKTDILDKEKVKAFSLKGETIITEKKELQTVLEG